MLGYNQMSAIISFYYIARLTTCKQSCLYVELFIYVNIFWLLHQTSMNSKMTRMTKNPRSHARTHIHTREAIFNNLPRFAVASHANCGSRTSRDSADRPTWTASGWGVTRRLVRWARYYTRSRSQRSPKRRRGRTRSGRSQKDTDAH